VNEKIVSAACKRGEKVWTGERHNKIIEQMFNEGLGMPVRQSEQGFLTSEGRFVDRYDAAVLAFEAGQTEILKSCLSSEDLW